MTAYTDFHYSPTGSGVISGAQVLEQTEQGINGLGQYVQDNVSGAIDVANQALTTAQSADSNATTAINLANSLNAQIIAANQTAGNALTTAQSAQNTANSASSLAATANNNAATALNTANSASAGVTTLTGTVNSLGNRMTAAENAISANAGNITTLQNNLATTNANVTAASNAASTAQATAASAQSTATLARNQAYVLRYTGTTITGGGTIAYADIDNTDNIKAGDKIIDISGAIYAIASVDTANQTVTVGASPVINLFCDAENLIPAANDAYDLGSSSYQWNNLYAKNYYYNGTAWGLDKANVWSAVNQYSREIQLAGDRNAFIAPMWEGAGSGIAFLVSDASKAICFGNYINDVNNDNRKIADTSTGRILIRVGTKDNETYTEIEPRGSNNRLGNSSNKFKTLNGINPGALSIFNPSVTHDPIDVPNTWVTDGSAWNTLNVSNIGDGWICLTYMWCGANDYILARFGGSNAAYPSMIFPATMLADSRYFLYMLVPVAKAMGNIYLEIKLDSNAVLVAHSFIPAYGTV